MNTLAMERICLLLLTASYCVAFTYEDKPQINVSTDQYIDLHMKDTFGITNDYMLNKCSKWQMKLSLLNGNQQAMDVTICTKDSSTPVQCQFPSNKHNEDWSRICAGNKETVFCTRDGWEFRSPHIFTLRSVTVLDGGAYTLAVICEGRSKSQSINVFVQGYPTEPQIIKESPEPSVIKLTCISHLTSQPERYRGSLQYSWSLSRINEKETQSTEVSPSFYNTSLDGSSVTISRTINADVNISCVAMGTQSILKSTSFREFQLTEDDQSTEKMATMAALVEAQTDNMILFVVAGVLGGVALLALVVVIYLMKSREDRTPSEDTLQRRKSTTTVVTFTRNPSLMGSTPNSPTSTLLRGLPTRDTYMDIDSFSGGRLRMTPRQTRQYLSISEASLCDNYSDVFDQTKRATLNSFTNGYRNRQAASLPRTLPSPGSLRAEKVSNAPDDILIQVDKAQPMKTFGWGTENGGIIQGKTASM